jgi:DNA polymerase elongation subunit (family B)
VLIANTFRIHGEVVKKLFAYNDYANDGEMIEDWARWVREKDPSILCGHNVLGFDIPYIQHVASLHNKDCNLGRDGSPWVISNKESKFRVDGSRDLHYNKVNIFGRNIIDTMFLAYRYDLARAYQSYRLKWIIEFEGLQKEDRVFYDASTIKDNFQDPVEFEKIKNYAADDGDDALALYDLMIPPFFYLSQMIPKSIQTITESASGSQLNSLMVRSYYQLGHSVAKASEPHPFEGAISFGNPGIYANSISYDVSSLYPSLMLQYNIHDKHKDPSNHMIKFLDYLRTARLKYKKLAKETGNVEYKHLDSSTKVCINSLYGFMGASGLNYNYPDGAAMVTAKGRETLTKSIEFMQTKGFNVVKGDTDSITIWDNNIKQTKEWAISLMEELNNIFPEHIKFELDAMYDVLVVFKAKNYAYREGGKISIKGSALKGSTKCEALKEFNKKIFEILLQDNFDKKDLQSLYLKYVDEIMKMPDIKRWAARKTLSSTMMESDRSNETKVMDALKGSSYTEGDRFYVFYRSDDSVCLVERFEGDYSKKRLLKNLFDTVGICDTIFPVKELFTNYSLVKNFKQLEALYESDPGV